MRIKFLSQKMRKFWRGWWGGSRSHVDVFNATDLYTSSG